MNLQSNPGNRLIINERNSGLLVQRDIKTNLATRRALLAH